MGRLQFRHNIFNNKGVLLEGEPYLDKTNNVLRIGTETGDDIINSNITNISETEKAIIISGNDSLTGSWRIYAKTGVNFSIQYNDIHGWRVAQRYTPEDLGTFSITTTDITLDLPNNVFYVAIDPLGTEQGLDINVDKYGALYADFRCFNPTVTGIPEEYNVNLVQESEVILNLANPLSFEIVINEDISNNISQYENVYITFYLYTLSPEKQLMKRTAGVEWS